MTYEERELLSKLSKDIDNELDKTDTHIISTHIDLIDAIGGDNLVYHTPLVSAIYNPENTNDDVSFNRIVTNRVSKKIHHLAVFEEFEKSYLIAFPLGKSVDDEFNCKDYFKDRVVRLRVDSSVYSATNFNYRLSHHVTSGYTDYDVLLYPVCIIIAEDSSLFPTSGEDRNYAICAIQEIVSRITGVNGSGGINGYLDYFFKMNENMVTRLDQANNEPYPDKLIVNAFIIGISLKNRIVKANDIIKLKNLPTIGGTPDTDNELSINVKYLDPDMPKIEIIDKGDWIDLCTVEDISLRKGDFRLIPLGVIIQIPEGYEALLLPRSSTFKKWGILVANSMGVIDNSYRGPEDQWMVAAYASRDIVIPKYTRIAQFRLLKNQPKITINEINEITEDSRGGFGSTGN